jgi:hypothetical protein
MIKGSVVCRNSWAHKDNISPSTGSKPKASGEAEIPIAFLLDENLGVTTGQCPWTRILYDCRSTSLAILSETSR